MATSKYVFMTPTRLSDYRNPNIRTLVYNLKTKVCSQIQAIKTSFYHTYVRHDNNTDDTITLGHYDTDNNNYSDDGVFFQHRMGDWVIIDITTHIKGNVTEYLDVNNIRNHYVYLHYVWEDFHKAVFGKTASESFRGGMVGEHGDKVYGYFEEWEEKNIPFFHGALLYLLTYIESEMDGYTKSQSSEFVIDKYQHYLPKIMEVEKLQLIASRFNLKL